MPLWGWILLALLVVVMAVIGLIINAAGQLTSRAFDWWGKNFGWPGAPPQR